MLQDLDVWVRTVDGDDDQLLVCVAPQLDGRVDDQTIYFDGHSQVLLAYHRRTWVAVGGDGPVLEWQCSVGEPASDIYASMPLTGERIASRVVHGLLKLRTAVQPTRVFVGFAHTREAVQGSIAAARARAAAEPTDVTGPADALVRQSRNVIRLLTSAETGGVLAGPPLQVDIASEPG